MPQAAELPGVLAAAREVRAAAHVLDIGGAARLAVSPDEAAPLLGLSPAQVRELCRSGALRARNLHPGSRNGRYLIPVSALVEYLAGRDDPVPSTG